MEHTYRIFTGSRIANGEFVAQIEGWIITTYHDPFTIIDNLLPGGADDTLIFCQKGIVPPLGTQIRLFIKAVK